MPASSNNPMNSKRLRVAVVGAGVAGIVASYYLDRQHDVTIFERNSYLGGHTDTHVVAAGPDAGTAIDTGFIVLNDRTYPLFTQFLKELAVGVRYADMSFSVYCERSGLQYASRGMSSLFAQRRNFLRPSFLVMLLEMPRFWRIARRELDDPRVARESLASFFSRHRFSRRFVEDFVLPLGAAIWSSPAKGIDEFPASTFLRFFDNHGWLSYYNQPRWQTVVGGSHEYIKAFRSRFAGKVCTEARIAAVRRIPSGGIELQHASGSIEQFDSVVLAAHADQSLALLADPSQDERDLLGAWAYSRNHTVLHTDESFLPPLKRAWASWNYRRELGEEGTEPVSVTYDMNALQGFRSAKRYLVTLNPRRKISPAAVVKEIEYTHPVYSSRSVASQPLLQKLNGARDTWFCGSYFGYGFHEDAVRSAVHVARGFGVRC